MWENRTGNLTARKADRWERQQIDTGNKLMALNKTNREGDKEYSFTDLVTYVSE